VTPCRAEAGAAMLESLAADPGNVKLRAETVCALLWMPLTHPLRAGSDELLAAASRIAKGAPVDLAALAKRLRDGAEAMRTGGWYPLAKVPVWDPVGP